MPEARRNRRGGILIPLGIAALTAATAGALYWYFTPRNDPVTTEKTTRRHPPQKRKSVVIVLTQDLIDRIPDYEVSRMYADVYLICPPATHGLLEKGDVMGKVEHETRVLRCATEQGIVHIARHIGADIILLGQEHLSIVEQVKGWTGKVVLVEKEVSRARREDNVVWSSWPETVKFEELLSLDSQR